MMALYSKSYSPGGAGKARFNVATPTYEARTRPLRVYTTIYVREAASGKSLSQL